ncbi:hypothetical protein HK102_009300 [Quaeritorhiza haematococci]|nr:hypothetical protein HK102_009300 [Quaeritorhiza haematococci]
MSSDTSATNTGEGSSGATRRLRFAAEVERLEVNVSDGRSGYGQAPPQPRSPTPATSALEADDDEIAISSSGGYTSLPPLIAPPITSKSHLRPPRPSSPSSPSPVDDDIAYNMSVNQNSVASRASRRSNLVLYEAGNYDDDGSGTGHTRKLMSTAEYLTSIWGGMGSSSGTVKSDDDHGEQSNAPGSHTVEVGGQVNPNEGATMSLSGRSARSLAAVARVLVGGGRVPSPEPPASLLPASGSVGRDENLVVIGAGIGTPTFPLGSFKPTPVAPRRVSSPQPTPDPGPWSSDDTDQEQDFSDFDDESVWNTVRSFSEVQSPSSPFAASPSSPSGLQMRSIRPSGKQTGDDTAEGNRQKRFTPGWRSGVKKANGTASDVRGRRGGRVGENSAGTAKSKTKNDVPLLGTIMGVYVPCLQNILGVIIFVRLAWIVGQAGIGQALLIAVMATTCTFLTALSMSAIATNGRVAAGGAYYMISRSLGKEFGGSVGILFYLANVVGCVMYTLGVVEILTEYVAPQISLGQPATNARVYGTVLLVLLASIVMVGIGVVNKASLVFFGAVVTAIAASLFGLLASNRPGMLSGVTGFPGNFAENLSPGYNKPDSNGLVGGVSFFELFGIFFPSVTGIMAGASRSGNLKDPGTSIPKGSLAAQITTSILYYVFIILLGTTVAGPLLRTKFPSTGLLVASVAWPSPWAVAKDGIIPFLRPFGVLSAYPPGKNKKASKRSGVDGKDVREVPVFLRWLPGGEPRRALFLSFVIAEAFVLIGNLDAVANVVTMLYLITYLFINLSCSLLGFLRSPSWRPSWKFYHWTVSALAGALCLAYMFMISWIWSLIALTIMVGVYKYIEFQGAQVQWGDGFQALNLQIAQRNLLALERMTMQQLGIATKERDAKKKDGGVSKKNADGLPEQIIEMPEDANEKVELSKDSATGDLSVPKRKIGAYTYQHVKNWRPQIMALVEVDHTTGAVKYPTLLDFLSQLRKGGGLTVLGSVIVGDVIEKAKEDAIGKAREILMKAAKEHHVNAFADVLISPSLKQGILSAVQCCGVGVLRPNTVVLGYPESWTYHEDPYSCERFVDVLRSIIALDRALLLIKGLSTFPGKLDKQPRGGTIDVYWIMHDGGILTLLPHLLRKHSIWRRCKLRIFAIAQLTDNSVAMKENLQRSLQHLRIDAEADVLELGDYSVSEYAYEKTMRLQEREELLKRAGVTGKRSIKDNVLALPSASSSYSMIENHQPRGAGGANDGGVGLTVHSAGSGLSSSGGHGLVDAAKGGLRRLSTALRHRPAEDGEGDPKNAITKTESTGIPPSLKSDVPPPSVVPAQDTTPGALRNAPSPPVVVDVANLHPTSDNIPSAPHSPSPSTSSKKQLSLTPSGGQPSPIRSLFAEQQQSVEVTSSSTTLSPEHGLSLEMDGAVSSSLKAAVAKTKETSNESPPMIEIEVPKTDNSQLGEEASPRPSTSHPPSVAGSTNLDRRIAMMNTSVKLNALMRRNSGEGSNCRLIFCNLPAPGRKPEMHIGSSPVEGYASAAGMGGGEGNSGSRGPPGISALDYMEYLDVLTEGLERVVLVKGTGMEVVTTFF